MKQLKKELKKEAAKNGISIYLPESTIEVRQVR